MKDRLQGAADKRGGGGHNDEIIDGDWQTFDDVRWSLNHAKLLYMISKYAVTAQSKDEDESWIRNVPLLVLVYEGIVKGVLDFDYAPYSTLISHEGVSRRSFMNVTQEGKSAVDDLREQNEELMERLRLTESQLIQVKSSWAEAEHEREQFFNQI